MTRTMTVEPDRRDAPGLESLIDVNAVAELLAVSTRTVFRMTDAGRLPAPIRLGRMLRWRKAAVLDWIAAGCPASGTARQSQGR